MIKILQGPYISYHLKQGRDPKKLFLIDKLVEISKLPEPQRIRASNELLQKNTIAELTDAIKAVINLLLVVDHSFLTPDDKYKNLKALREELTPKEGQVASPILQIFQIKKPKKLLGLTLSSKYGQEELRELQDYIDKDLIQTLELSFMVSMSDMMLERDKEVDSGHTEKTYLNNFSKIDEMYTEIIDRRQQLSDRGVAYETSPMMRRYEPMIELLKKENHEYGMTKEIEALINKLSNNKDEFFVHLETLSKMIDTRREDHKQSDIKKLQQKLDIIRQQEQTILPPPETLEKIELKPNQEGDYLTCAKGYLWLSNFYPKSPKRDYYRTLANVEIQQYLSSQIKSETSLSELMAKLDTLSFRLPDTFKESLQDKNLIIKQIVDDWLTGNKKLTNTNFGELIGLIKQLDNADQEQFWAAWNEQYSLHLSKTSDVTRDYAQVNQLYTRIPKEHRRNIIDVLVENIKSELQAEQINSEKLYNQIHEFNERFQAIEENNQIDRITEDLKGFIHHKSRLNKVVDSSEQDYKLQAMYFLFLANIYKNTAKGYVHFKRQAVAKIQQQLLKQLELRPLDDAKPQNIDRNQVLIEKLRAVNRHLRPSSYAIEPQLMKEMDEQDKNQIRIKVAKYYLAQDNSPSLKTLIILGDFIRSFSLSDENLWQDFDTYLRRSLDIQSTDPSYKMAFSLRDAVSNEYKPRCSALIYNRIINHIRDVLTTKPVNTETFYQLLQTFHKNLTSLNDNDRLYAFDMLKKVFETKQKTLLPIFSSPLGTSESLLDIKANKNSIRDADIYLFLAELYQQDVTSEDIAAYFKNLATVEVCRHLANKVSSPLSNIERSLEFSINKLPEQLQILIDAEQREFIYKQAFLNYFAKDKHSSSSLISAAITLKEIKNDNLRNDLQLWNLLAEKITRYINENPLRTLTEINGFIGAFPEELRTTTNYQKICQDVVQIIRQKAISILTSIEQAESLVDKALKRLQSTATMTDWKEGLDKALSTRALYDTIENFILSQSQSKDTAELKRLKSLFDTYPQLKSESIQLLNASDYKATRQASAPPVSDIGLPQTDENFQQMTTEGMGRNLTGASAPPISDIGEIEPDHATKPDSSTSPLSSTAEGEGVSKENVEVPPADRQLSKSSEGLPELDPGTKARRIVKKDSPSQDPRFFGSCKPCEPVFPKVPQHEPTKNTKSKSKKKETTPPFRGPPTAGT